MRNLFLAVVALTGLLLVAPHRAEAHHGYAAFDQKTMVTLNGTVTDFLFVNPHSIIDFEVKDAKGQVRKWRGELTSPSHLVPRGWSATSLEPGDEITVIGYVTKNGTPSMWVHKINAKGKELRIVDDPQ